MKKDTKKKTPIFKTFKNQALGRKLGCCKAEAMMHSPFRTFFDKIVCILAYLYHLYSTCICHLKRFTILTLFDLLAHKRALGLKRIMKRKLLDIAAIILAL